MAVTLVAVALVSCGGGGGGGGSSPPPVSVSVSPAMAGVFVGGAVQFMATVSDATDTTVTWQVNHVAGGNATTGRISSSGLYVAPPAAPSPAAVTITAVSKADFTKSASASVTIMAFSDAALNGQYAFSVSSGTIASIAFVAGSFTADGNGNITNGVEDINDSTGVSSGVTFSGSYSITPDGRGAATVSNSIGTASFRFVVLSSSQALIIEFDSSGDQDAGVIAKQDPSAFSESALQGSYSFSYAGLDLNVLSGLGAAGTFTADGKGVLSAGAEDINDGGAISPNASFTGSYSSVDSNGRGTAALGNSGVAFYIVSAGRLLFVSTDPSALFTGEAEQRLPGQGSTSFSNASLSGDYTFSLSGLGGPNLDTAVAAGRFTADGKGSVANGVEDQNNGGVVSQNVAFTGSYSISSTGRGTVTLAGGAATASLAFYLVSATRAMFVETDSGASATGVADAETGGPFTAASIAGAFGFVLSGESMPGSISGGGEEEISGQFTADGMGNLTAGSEDVNDSVTLSPGVALTGAYALSSNDRGAATIKTAGGTAELVFYVTSASQLELIEVDPNLALAGIARHF